jgi:hypothetical protein
MSCQAKDSDFPLMGSIQPKQPSKQEPKLLPVQPPAAPMAQTTVSTPVYKDLVDLQTPVTPCVSSATTISNILGLPPSSVVYKPITPVTPPPKEGACAVVPKTVPPPPKGETCEQALKRLNITLEDDVYGDHIVKGETTPGSSRIGNSVILDKHQDFPSAPTETEVKQSSELEKKEEFVNAVTRLYCLNPSLKATILEKLGTQSSAPATESASVTKSLTRSQKNSARLKRQKERLKQEQIHLDNVLTIVSQHQKSLPLDLQQSESLNAGLLHLKENWKMTTGKKSPKSQKKQSNGAGQNVVRQLKQLP